MNTEKAVNLASDLHRAVETKIVYRIVRAALVASGYEGYVTKLNPPDGETTYVWLLNELSVMRGYSPQMTQALITELTNNRALYIPDEEEEV